MILDIEKSGENDKQRFKEWLVKMYPGYMYLLYSQYREYVYSVVVYQKYQTRLRELIIFEPWRENYNFSQPS